MYFALNHYLSLILNIHALYSRLIFRMFLSFILRGWNKNFEKENVSLVRSIFHITAFVLNYTELIWRIRIVSKPQLDSQ